MDNRTGLFISFQGGGDYSPVDFFLSAEGFSGSTGYAVHPEEIKPFLSQLSAFPLSDPARLIVGAELRDGPLVDIAVVRADLRGTLEVSVTLADDRDRSRRVSASFTCVHSDAIRFVEEIKLVMLQGGEAALSPAE